MTANVSPVDTDDWLTDTRTSYDTVADSYADQLREALDGASYARAALALFAELVRAIRGGPVADVGCGPGHVTAHLRDAGFAVEAQMLLDPDGSLPGAILFARRPVLAAPGHGLPLTRRAPDLRRPPGGRLVWQNVPQAVPAPLPGAGACLEGRRSDAGVRGDHGQGRELGPRPRHP